MLFSGTNGKTIKDSNYNVGSFAVKNHTHTVSQITDFPEIPEAITVDSALSTTSENPVQNKVITTQLNNKVNNATLSSYVKTVDLNTTLGNYYTTTEVYTKKQVDDKIPSLNGYATESWVTNQGYSTENTWRPVKVGSTTLSDSSTTLTIANGTGIGLTLANGTLTITNSAPGSSYTLPVAKDNILGGIKTGYTESGGAEMAIYTLEDGTAYTLLRDTAVKTALGFTPANVNDIPIALPNPYALNITAGGSSTNYTGSATANLNLDKVFSKKLATVTTPGQPGIFVGTAASYEKQIAILNNRIDELEKQLEVYQAKENEITQEEEKQLEHIPVKRRIIWSSFFHDSKIKRKEELDIQEQAERERLAKEYIYDPSHSEEQAALFLDAAGTEEWTLEDLRTLAAQSDIDSMKILQRKIEQLHKASQKKK